MTGKSLADNIGDLIWSKIGAESDASIVVNEKKFPEAGAGMSATLRDVARFGLLFTKSAGPEQRGVISEQIVKRILVSRGTTLDNRGMLRSLISGTC